VTVRDRIPVTTVARTLVDIRATLAPYLVRRAVREAEFLGLALGEIKTDRTRSELERYFLRLCRRYGLPLPEVNVLIDGMTVDFLWREARLVVETDSYATHGGTVAFDNDRERDLRLRRLGYSVHHFSEQQLQVAPAAVAEDVAAALRAAQAPGAVG
jgi:very-short-patch-repair endonuclease